MEPATQTIQSTPGTQGTQGTQTAASALSCPTCDAGLAVPTDVMLGEILGCDDCGVELEITALDPLGVAEAPEVAEDWGE